MKKLLNIILFLIAFQNVNVFGQALKESLIEKVNIVSDVIDRLSELSNTKKQISTGLINSMSRKVSLEEGFAYNGIKFSSYVTDSLFMEELRKKYSKKNFLLLEYSQIDSYRNDIINSSSAFNRDSCNYCTKLYFEINCPIQGWENLEIFLMIDNKQIADTIFFDKYYTKQLSIPVFVYTLTNGISNKTSYVFLYELIKGNKFRFIKSVVI